MKLKCAGNWVLPVLFFLTISLVLTWPVVLHPTTHIFGMPGDSTGSIYDLWNWRRTGLRLFGTYHVNLRGAPFGYELNNWPLLTMAIPISMGWLLTHLVGEIAAYNILILVALTGSAIGMYAACRLLGMRLWSSLWGGFAFLLFPFLQLAAGGWYSQAQLATIPIQVAMWIRLVEQPSRRDILTVLGLVLVTAFINPYLLLFSLCMALVGLVGMLSLHWRNVLTLRNVIVFSFATTVAVLVSQQLINKIDGLFARSPAEIEVFGLRFRELFFPTFLNTALPNWIPRVTANQFHGSNAVEVSQFLGYLTLSFAALGLLLRPPSSQISRRGRTWLVLLSLSMFWVAASQGISLFGAELPRPAVFISNLAPFWRVYSRIGLVLMAITVILAVNGLNHLLSQVRKRWSRILLLIACCLITTVDLTSPTPQRVTELATESIVSKLRSGNGTIVVYPIVIDGELISYEQNFLQRIHQRPMLNGGTPGSTARLAQESVKNLEDKQLSVRLTGLGINQVVVDERNYEATTGLHPKPADARLRLQWSENGISIYEVIRSRGAFSSFWLAGAGIGEPKTGGSTWHWLASEATIQVTVSEIGCWRVSGHIQKYSGVPHLFLSALQTQLEIHDGEYELYVRPSAKSFVMSYSSKGISTALPPPDGRLVSAYVTSPFLERVHNSMCDGNQ